MFKQLLVLMLFSSFLACTKSDSGDLATDACDTLGLNTRSAINKIVQGTECSRAGSPVVALTVLPTDGNVAICSGSMITNRKVLTAAHCFDLDYTSVSVQAAGIDIPVSRITLHPQFNADQIPFQNDVAIVELARDAGVPTLPLILSKTLEPRDKISIFGYGADENLVAGILRSGEMRVTGINSQFFTAEFDLDGSNICNGDSGGPAIYSFKDNQGVRRTGIIGLTSFGQDPCEDTGTSGFQYIQSTAVLNFITATVPEVVVQ
jgi:secreted trypsin-like serine protease